MYLFLFYVWVSYLHVSMRIIHVPGAHRGQEKSSELLELELWMVVNHQVSAENWTWALCEINMYSSPGS